MAASRVIRKYGNRRLYDTEASCYVNLEAVAGLVRKGHHIQVVDAKSGEDLTRSVLTQIIVEEARDSDRGPPLDFLRGLIRAQDRAQRDFLEWYLGTAAEVYQKVQEAWRGQAGWPSLDLQRETWAKMWDPFGAVRAILRAGSRSASRPARSPETEAASARREAGSPPAEGSGEKAAPPPADAPTRDEVAELRRRLEELEARLADR